MKRVTLFVFLSALISTEGFNVGKIEDTWSALHHQDGPEEDPVLAILKVQPVWFVSKKLFECVKLSQPALFTFGLTWCVKTRIIANPPELVLNLFLFYCQN